MDTDLTKNVVVFELGRPGEPNGMAEAPTRHPGCIQQAWDIVRREHEVRADEVLSIFTEWEPSEQDGRFIAETFPMVATVQFHFSQPGPGGWDEAFESARVLVAQGLEAEAEEVEEDLLPLLWSGSAPQAALLEAIPHWTLVPDRLHVALALVAPTPHGTIGLNHVTHHQVSGSGNDFTDLMDMGYDELRQGLRIDGRESADGDLITVHRNGSVAAAALALPDFHTHMSELLGAQRLIVGLHCQQNLLVAEAGTEQAGRLEQAVLSAEGQEGELVPSVWLLERSGLDLVAERS